MCGRVRACVRSCAWTARCRNILVFARVFACLCVRLRACLRVYVFVDEVVCMRVRVHARMHGRTHDDAHAYSSRKFLGSKDKFPGHTHTH